MKLTAILLTVFFLQVRADGISQTITFSGKEVPLQKVFAAIEKQTGYIFFYTMDIWKEARPVSINVKNAAIDAVLKLVMKEQPFSYIIENKTVIISRKKETIVQEANGDKALSPPDPIEVRGVITDENGAPAQGVNVMVRGTSRGTTTNLRGEFILKDIDENAVLIITSIGYDRQEIPVKNKAIITTQLRIAVGNLDEMQVVAYGKVSKRLNTGNVTTVKAIDIERQPVNNPLLTLQGRVPGLYITQSTGLPGSGVTVRIQGQNSAFYGSDPLYVIDGVPYFSQIPSVLNGILGSSNGMVAGSGGNPLSFINPSSIESIEVLKDADATSIYGSRAANGAILITTKKGKAGQTKVDLNLQIGFGKVDHMLSLLNTQQYLEMRHEAKANDGASIDVSDFDINGTWDTTRYTDWQKELIGNTAKYQNFQVNVSGGNANTQFMIGAGYNKQTTVFPGSLGDQKGSVHFNINNISTNQRFNIQLSGHYQIDDNKLSNQNFVTDAIGIPPHAPELYQSDGSLNWAPSQSGTSTWRNPMAFLAQKYNNKTTNLISNAVVGYQILRGLEIRTSLGYNNFKSNEINTFPLTSLKPERRATSSNYSLFGNNTVSTWIVEPQVVYKNKIGKGKLEALIGTTIQQSNTSGQQLWADGFSSELVMEDTRSAATLSVLSTTSTKYKYNALFGRINFNWEDKYLANVTARRDGSSRFGAENRFHNFASVGLAWVFSKERLFDKNSSLFSFGKLRASYGTTGNDQIGDYNFISLYNPVDGQPYQGIVGLNAGGLSNPYLQWEETKKMQVGLDLGFLKDRILFNGNYYRNRSSNQLMGFATPIITGFGGILSNFPATIQNSGWELTLSTVNVKTSNVKWTSSINVTIAKNSLVSFSDLKSSWYADYFVIGQPITILHSYHFLGVNETTGLYEYAAKDGSFTSDPKYPADAMTLINTAPTLYGGFQNNIQYKGFQLDFLFQFVKQKGQDYFYGNLPGAYFGGANFGNQPASVMERWQKPGDISSIQKLSSSYQGDIGQAFFAIQGSDGPRTDASFIRLKNISLSWELPKTLESKIHVNGCRFFILGQNVLTITNFYGLDPEAGGYNLSVPPLRVFTFGMQVTF